MLLVDICWLLVRVPLHYGILLENVVRTAHCKHHRHFSKALLIVSWQTSSSPLRIVKIICQQKEASFAVFYSSDGDVAEAGHKTKIAVFQTISSTPTSIHHVPFGLRNVAPLTCHRRSSYSFVGITDAFRVVVLGDSEPTFKDDGLFARGINLEAPVPKKTLFHDIFGTAAFTDSLAEIVSAPHPPSRQEGRRELFNGPVYMAPQFDLLFEAANEGVLMSRPTENARSFRDYDDLGEEDLEAEYYKDTSKSHIPRLPIAGEMNIFIRVFKDHHPIGVFLVDLLSLSQH